jgi:hypothetical protein
MSNPIMFSHGSQGHGILGRVIPNRSQITRAALFALLLSFFFVASISLAHSQSFSISMPLGLNRPAVDPGGSALGTIDLTSTGGFNNPVTFTCVVSSGPVTSSQPNCVISPVTQTPPGSASLTITTTNATSVGLYNLTVTATASGSIPQTLSLSLSVQPLSEDYTLSVTPVTAVPNPVKAGSVATTTVTISPIGSYSGHQVTLACLSVTPVVTTGPSCAFTPTAGSGPGPVQVTGGTPATATLTITTYGPTPTTLLQTHRTFYAFWLLAPAFVFAGARRARGSGKRLLGFLSLAVLASLLLLIPACGSSTPTNSPTGATTPKNTYTFTLGGADENGAGPSNATTAAATVSVTVN